jgi:enoyl-CoA hydratase/carnithine racemase
MLINRGLEIDFAAELGLEARVFGNLATSHDLYEGTLAFSPKKRKPNFTGN